MTNDAPKRVNILPEYAKTLPTAEGRYIRGVWYIREDHAQAEVAAAYLDAADFAADTADQGEGSDGVLWADMTQVVDAIESRTPNDAKASLDHLLKAELKAAVAAEREACAECCTAELRNTAQLLSNPPQSSAAWDARNAIRARGDTDALAARDARVRAEALREAAEICAAARDKRNKQRNDYPDEIRDVKQRWMAGALQSQSNADAILALIPDEHKVDG